MKARWKLWSCLLAVATVVALAWILEDRSWQDYKKAHNCVVAAQVNQPFQVGYAIDNRGRLATMFTEVPSKTAWRCDNNITYWR